MTPPNDSRQTERNDADEAEGLWHARNLLRLCVIIAVIIPLHLWYKDREADRDRQLELGRLMHQSRIQKQNQETAWRTQRGKLESAFEETAAIFRKHSLAVADVFRSADSSKFMHLRRLADEQMADGLRGLSARTTNDGLFARVYLQLWDEVLGLREQYYRDMVDVYLIDAPGTILAPESRADLDRALVAMQRLSESNLAFLENMRGYADRLDVALEASGQLERGNSTTNDPFGIRTFIDFSEHLAVLQVELAVHEGWVGVGTLLRDNWGSWSRSADDSIEFHNPDLDAKFRRALSQTSLPINVFLRFR